MECQILSGSANIHVCACIVLGFVLGAVFMSCVFGFIFGLAKDNEAFEENNKKKKNYIPYGNVFGYSARKRFAEA